MWTPLNEAISYGNREMSTFKLYFEFIFVKTQLKF